MSVLPVKLRRCRDILDEPVILLSNHFIWIFVYLYGKPETKAPNLLKMSEFIHVFGHFAPLSGILQTGWESALLLTGAERPNGSRQMYRQVSIRELDLKWFKLVE